MASPTNPGRKTKRMVKKLEIITTTESPELLLLESKEAATVILMLDSPEDQIVCAACVAIFRHSEKSDENKISLLTLGALDKLLRLLQHNELYVRRNACMAFSSLSRHSEVRAVLKNKEETIPLIVCLLTNEQETALIQEYALLCITSLAVDFSTKVRLCRHGALYPLVRCLSHTDPDIQKNAVEALALLLQDYKSKSCLLAVSGSLQALINLLCSNFPVIQYNALISLSLASVDVDVRCALLDLGIVARLIEFLSNPSTSELHVYAVAILANCLDHPKSMQLIKDGGGLVKLAKLLNDIQLVAEEEVIKKPKKEKDKTVPMASRSSVIPVASKSSSKKGAKDDDPDEKQKGREISPPVREMPDIAEPLAMALGRAARNDKNLRIVHDEEVEKKLIALLNQPDKHQVQAASAFALAVMCENGISRETIRENDGVSALIKLLTSPNPDVLDASSLAVANLSVNNSQNCTELFKGGACAPLVTLLFAPRETTVVNAIAAIGNMSLDTDVRSELINLKVMVALIEGLKSTSALVNSSVTLTLSSLAIDAEARIQFMEAGGFYYLVKLLNAKDLLVVRYASYALCVFGSDEQMSAEIFKYDAVDTLRQIQLSPSRTNAFSEMALNKLLDTYLPAKYSYSGFLANTDTILDGFYDAGWLKTPTRIMTLEEYGMGEICDRRPIFLVNAKLEKVISQNLSVDAATLAPSPPDGKPGGKSQSGSPSVSSVGRASRANVTGRDSKMIKRTIKVEKEEKQEKVKSETELQQQLKEVELVDQVCEPEMYVAHGDNDLMCYVEHCQTVCQNLKTICEQIHYISMFVYEKMGGALTEQLKMYSCHHMWELKEHLKNNVIPIGMVKYGVQCHRALLFKTIADRVGLQCTLVRGDYHRGWNEVTLSSMDMEEEDPSQDHHKTSLQSLISAGQETGKELEQHETSAHEAAGRQSEVIDKSGHEVTGRKSEVLDKSRHEVTGRKSEVLNKSRHEVAGKKSEAIDKSKHEVAGRKSEVLDKSRHETLTGTKSEVRDKPGQEASGKGSEKKPKMEREQEKEVEQLDTVMKSSSTSLKPDVQVSLTSLAPLVYVVNLTTDPGKLMDCNSCESIEYTLYQDQF